jgi:sugar O-acyltransferase (sialic acid O-acetyltransferase NeuD family)
MKNLIIFGTGKIAEVVHYYATEECGFNVVCFTVDRQFIKSDKFLGLPVIPFEEVEQKYAPSENLFFVAVGYHDLNKVRELRCLEATKKGYELTSVISPNANIPKNVKPGTNCFIMPPALIHPCVTIGDNVFVWSGAVVGHHSVLKNNCWITSGCNISGNVVIGENSFLAINATIAHSVSIGKDCFIGANALIIKNLEDEKVCFAESTKPIKLTSRQFLKMSNFSNL